MKKILTHLVIVLFSVFSLVYTAKAQREIDEYSEDFNLNYCLHQALFDPFIDNFEVPAPLHYSSFHSDYALLHKIKSSKQVSKNYSFFKQGYVKTNTKYDRKGHILIRKIKFIGIKPEYATSEQLSNINDIPKQRTYQESCIERYEYTSGNHLCIKVDSIINGKTFAYKQINCHYTAGLFMDTVVVNYFLPKLAETTYISLDTIFGTATELPKISVKQFYKSDKKYVADSSLFLLDTNRTGIAGVPYFSFSLYSNNNKEYLSNRRHYIETFFGLFADNKFTKLTYDRNDTIRKCIYLNDESLVYSKECKNKNAECINQHVRYFNWSKGVFKRSMNDYYQTALTCMLLGGMESRPAEINKVGDNLYELIHELRHYERTDRMTPPRSELYSPNYSLKLKHRR
jgi:hypothetical protein